MRQIKQRTVYSESFKRDKVREIEQGKLTPLQLSKMLGMNFSGVIYKWMARYGTQPTTEKVVVETESDYLRLVELERRNTKLEQLIGRQQVEISIMEEILNAVKDHYGEDPKNKFLKK